MAERDAIGNTPTMTTTPPPTHYHRWLGWHAPAMRRAVIVSSIGLLVVVVLGWFLPWGLAVVAGWDTAALAFLLSIWPVILRADGPHAAQLATREDETRGQAAVLLLGASVASLLGVGFTLRLAGGEGGPPRVLLIGAAVLTVGLSWTVVNTVYTLRYAHLHFSSRGAGIGFGDGEGQEPPTYRDFAYVAFTIGMCYQVSDTTVRDRRIRGTVLFHAFLSYVFGVVIVAGSVNLASPGLGMREGVAVLTGLQCRPEAGCRTVTSWPTARSRRGPAGDTASTQPRCASYPNQATTTKGRRHEPEEREGGPGRGVLLGDAGPDPKAPRGPLHAGGLHRR